MKKRCTRFFVFFIFSWLFNWFFLFFSWFFNKVYVIYPSVRTTYCMGVRRYNQDVKMSKRQNDNVVLASCVGCDLAFKFSCKTTIRYIHARKLLKHLALLNFQLRLPAVPGNMSCCQHKAKHWPKKYLLTCLIRPNRHKTSFGTWYSNCR